MRLRFLALALVIGCPGSDPVEITTTELPAAIVGQDYTFQLAAGGGDGSFEWSVVDALPTGFTLSAAGAINGRGTTAGSFNFTAAVKSDGEQAQRGLVLVVQPAPPAKLEIATSDLLQARVGDPYQRSIAAQGGTRDYSWSVEGALPPGLLLSASGYPATELAGVPSADGDYTFTIVVTDAAGVTASREYTLTVQPVQPPQFDIRSFLLPDGVVGHPYAATLQVENASGAVDWTLEAGDFPLGLVFDRTGDPHTTVTGTPSTAGEYVFVLRATDVDGDTDAQQYTVTVSPAFVPIEIETSSVPAAIVGVPYLFTVVARYGTGSNFTWSVTGGQLPPGLMLETSGTPGALINGTSNVRGTWTATITVRDGNGDTAARELEFAVVDPPLEIATTLLPGGDLGVPYSETLFAVGGSGSGYSWRISAGNPPTGVTLQPSTSDSVILSGNPTIAGVYDFAVEVMDSSGQVDTHDFSVRIYAPVEITTQTLPDAEAGGAYSTTIAVQGGSGGYLHQVSAGSLPPGLTLSPAGVVSGIATTLGDSDFTVTVTDSRGRTGSRQLSITVFSPVVLTIVTPSLPGAGAGVAYTGTIAAAGGTGAGYTWSVENGALPPGLGITPAATPVASITGATLGLGSYTFTVRVTDSAGGTAIRSFTIDVLAPLSVTTPSLPARIECASQRDMLVATGGSGTGYTWSIVSGAPPGLDIDRDGTPSTLLRGRGTAPATYTTTIRVRDSAGLVAERTYSIVVDPDPDAQHWAVLVGDLVGSETEVFLTDVCGDEAFGLAPMNPPAPGTGNASLDPKDVAFSPDLARVAFIGDFLIDGTDELFISTADDPATRRRISGPQVANGDVSAFWWSPDSTLIAYLADQNLDGIDELFVVDVTDPAAPFFPVQASTVLIGANSDVTHVSWAPDSNGLVYRADATDGVFELFWVNLSIPTVPGIAVRLHNALTAPRSCDSEMDWAPAGNAVVFRCDAATAGTIELWYVRFTAATPAAAQRVNGALVANGDVQPGFGFSPDGSGVAYIADQNADEVFEVYIAVTFGGIVPGVRAMNALAANEDVTSFRFAPSGFRGLVRGDLDADEVFELYLLDASGGLPASTVRVNGAMTAGGDVDATSFSFSPDGSRVAYLADQTTNDHAELFLSDVSGPAPGAAVRISPVLGAGAGTSVDRFEFSADSARVAMLGDFTTPNQVELAATLPAGAAQIVHGPLPSGGDVTSFFWRSSSDGIFFTADLLLDGDAAGWSVDLSGATPGAPLPLHPLPPGGDLEFFWLEP